MRKLAIVAVLLLASCGGGTPGGPGPEILTTSLPKAIAGEKYSEVLSASGCVAYRWSATGLPAGLQLAATGVISGQATKVGTYSVKVQVSCG